MCPYLESGQTRCASVLTLANYDEALDRCATHYCQCPIYRDLLAEDQHNRDRQRRNRILPLAG